MEDKGPYEDSAEKQNNTKRKSNNFGFLFYAIAVFTILGIGLWVIVMRSNQVM
jgi:nitrate reductase NapE component